MLALLHSENLASQVPIFFMQGPLLKQKGQALYFINFRMKTNLQWMADVLNYSWEQQLYASLRLSSLVTPLPCQETLT